MILIQNYTAPSKNIWVLWKTQVFILDYPRKQIFKTTTYAFKEIINYISAGFLLKVEYEINSKL